MLRTTDGRRNGRIATRSEQRAMLSHQEQVEEFLRGTTSHSREP
jgi:hypothetical protein